MKRVFSKKQPSPSTPLPDWLSPLPEAAPCGPNLEYDAEYAVLISRMTPKGEVQYGDFVSTADTPDWTEVERDCRRLLLRSRDIAILILFLRCRTRLAQAEGLRDGLALLVALLQRYPEQLHPQRIIDGESDPAVRANALAALTDAEGLLSDIREILIIKSSAMRLQVRDVECAHAMRRSAEGPAPDAVRRQLAELRQHKQASLMALNEAAGLAATLSKLVTDDLGDAAPDLSRLTALLSLFSAELGKPDSVNVRSPRSSTAMTPEADVTALPTPAAASDAFPGTKPALTDYLPAVASGNPLTEREAALRLIQQSRSWFELHEPSSPVAVLLQQAEKLVGKRFTEVAQIIPLELLQSWERES